MEFDADTWLETLNAELSYRSAREGIERIRALASTLNAQQKAEVLAIALEDAANDSGYSEDDVLVFREIFGN